MLNRSLISISVNGDKVWTIKHDVEKLESNFLKITNDIITDLNTVKITENLIAYSSRTLDDFPDNENC